MAFSSNSSINMKKITLSIFTFLTFLVLPVSNNALASSCTADLALGNEYYNMAESALDIGLLNYEKAFGADRQGDYELACEYLELSHKDLLGSIDFLDMAETTYRKVTANCSGTQNPRPKKNWIQPAAFNGKHILRKPCWKRAWLSVPLTAYKKTLRINFLKNT